MAATRQQFQTFAHAPGILGLGQDAPSGRHHRIGGQNKSLVQFRHRQGFFPRQALGMQARLLALFDAFINRGGNDQIGHNTGLRQQRLTPRAFAGQDEFSGSDR